MLGRSAYERLDVTSMSARRPCAREWGRPMVKKSRRVLIVFACLAALCVVGLFAVVARNQAAASYEDLSETDRAVLSEYNTLYESLLEDDIWDGFGLEEKTILALAGDWGDGYLINPAEPVSSIFAKEISLPEDWSITVYRVSAAEPGLMPLRLAGNFNTVGETYALFGSPLYFVKYDGDASVSMQWSSDHFSALLAHEAFHYYMQDEWEEGSRFSTEGLTDADVALLGEEYRILATIQDEFLTGAPDQAALKEAAEEYVDVMGRRMEANPEYVRHELAMETMEGTAQYVGIQACRRVGYDLGVMYFTNQKDVSFDEVMPQYEAGGIDKSFFADRMPYETGALLCLLMDELDVSDWQARLNAQTLDAPVTLYSILEGWL